LLQAAFQEVYHSGFQGSDLEAILDRAGVTKGALYHHFENKEALGYAVVDEVLATMMRDKWLRPLEHAKNPIDALARIVRSTSTKPEWLRRGCPINNLAQEMSPLDEGFRRRLATLVRIGRLVRASKFCFFLRNEHRNWLVPRYQKSKAGPVPDLERQTAFVYGAIDL
jgi:AcrR family transcriptional regulator